MVGGLIEQQQVGGLKQQLAQRHTAAFTTRAHGDRGVRVRALQRVHRLLELRVEVPAVGGVDLVLFQLVVDAHAPLGFDLAVDAALFALFHQGLLSHIGVGDARGAGRNSYDLHTFISSSNFFSRS